MNVPISQYTGAGLRTLEDHTREFTKNKKLRVKSQIMTEIVAILRDL